MNSDDIVPGNFADEFVCSYCCNELGTENEILNQVCFACQDSEQTQAKLDTFDNLVAASRHLLHLSEQIADDIPADFKIAWHRATNRLCGMLRASHSI
jgi:hypothetical protein